jgi:hypothetical protein
MCCFWSLLIVCIVSASLDDGLDDLLSHTSVSSHNWVKNAETTISITGASSHREATVTMTGRDAPSSTSGIFGMLRNLGITMQAAMLLSAGNALSSPLSQSSSPGSGSPAVPDYTTSEAGNPFVDGWYADPDTAIYNDLYWIYPTSSAKYEQQTYLDAFSSPDLITWTKHPNILTIADVKWAKKAVWAPAPAFRNGKYYIYFGANDIQEEEPEKGLVGGIGVAVADKPEGPYIDAIGKPLIGEYHNGAQPIDQDVFIDDDGQAYIYYGGHSFANVAKLNDDMISLGKLDDGTTFKNITPKNYVEGSQMIKRNGIYYFMWSEGGWTGPNYSVSYAMADSPLGPFERKARILQQDPAVAKGSGHNGVIRVPDTDIYYIVYHRRPLSESDQNHRVLAYDRMYFDKDGAIAPVHMLVEDNFADGNMLGWKTHGGEWEVVDQRLEVESTTVGMALLDTNFTDLIFDATLSFPDENESKGSAGLVFRATGNATVGFSGYYVGLSPSGILSLESFQTGTQVAIANVSSINVQSDAESDYDYEIRVTALGERIEVFVDDLDVPKLTVNDETFSTGKNGVMVMDTAATFGDVSILKPDET